MLSIGRASLIVLLSLLVLALFAATANTVEKSPPADTSPQSASRHIKTLVLGSGCFWGAEKGYESLPGVIDAVSGYADGRGIAPSYEEITKLKYRLDPNNYAEVVAVRYNTEQVSTEFLLQYYFEHHDPTQKNRQGNDIGTQYRSIILYTDDEQKRTAEDTRQAFQSLLSAAGRGAIVTEIKPLETFHPAEDYHQDYLKKNPDGYCPDHSTGVTFKKTPKPATDNTALLNGKQILVLEAEFCPYCEAFRKNVADAYQGSIPLTFRDASQLDGLTLKTPTWATPTIIFLEDGSEVFGRQGYMAPAEFYQALGRFKLGDTEAYDVAFNQATDNRFCKQYEEFKNTPDGVFIDKLSGAPLFDTRYRFNSGTGWLSFTEPVAGATVEKPDNSYGMNRIEVLSQSSGAHLGHVFDDGPDGKPRYCINATVLEFKPR